MLQSAIEQTREIAFFGSARENAELSGQLARAFDRVMTSGKLLNGPEVFAFEDRIAADSQRAHAVAVNSATDALYFALVAHGIGPGDEVLVPAYSFIASASCVLRAGAKPVFVDVLSPEAGGAPGTLDLNDAKPRIGPATKAMIWVGLFGGAGDPAPIRAFAESHGLTLIEDASQSFGAAWADIPAGKMGHSSVFSFDRNKLVGAPGTGGALVTDDPDVAEKARSQRYHGVVGGNYDCLGQNSQLSSLTAAILQIKLAHHEGWTARRREIAAAYDSALSELPVTVLRWPTEAQHVWHKYVFLTRQRDELEAHLKYCGVPTKRHYNTALPRERVFERQIAANEHWPVAERMSSEALSLPIYAQITDEEVAYVTESLRSFFG